MSYVGDTPVDAGTWLQAGLLPNIHHLSQVRHCHFIALRLSLPATSQSVHGPYTVVSLVVLPSRRWPTTSLDAARHLLALPAPRFQQQ